MSGSAGAVLLDTCALIWLANSGPMSRSALLAIEDAAVAGFLFVSPVSAWEIGRLAKKQREGRFAPQFLPDARAWFSAVMSAPGIRVAAFTPEIALDVSMLPGAMHSDPADRMLVATARHFDVPIVTSDRRIIAYGEQGLVKVLPC